MTSIASRRYFKLTTLFICLTLVGFLAFSFVSNSQAAAKLVNTIPNKDQYLDYSGDVIQVRLEFDNNVKAEGSVIQVIKDQGSEKNVTVPAVAIDPGNPKVAFITIGAKSALGSNKYTVNYSIISADDNTPVAGNYEFYIKPPASSPIDLGYIFSTPTTPFTTNWYGYNYLPLSVIYFLVAILGTIAGNFFFFYGKYFFKRNLLTYTLVNRSSRAIAIASSLGLFFFLCRFPKLQPFDARFFLYVPVVLAIVYFFRGIGWSLRSYPKARAEWREHQARERRKVEKEEEARREKAERAERRQATPIVPAKVATTSTSSADGDAEDDGEGGDADGKELPAGTAIARGSSTRGEKRRAKKRARK
jgi:methionine-rich copper-binding protein CopC